MLKHMRAILVVGAVTWLLLPAMAVAASSAPKPAPQSVTQGYAARNDVQLGMIVQLNGQDSKEVIPLTNDVGERMLGTVIAPADTAVTLSSDANTNQVFVATYGRHDVIVSNQNGVIKTGDYITISALSGIGMKADKQQPVVLGQAAGGFDGTSGVESTTKLKTSKGGTVTVAIGRIPVNIAIAHNPLQQTVEEGLPGFLGTVTQQVAGHQVASTKVYLGLVILLAASALAGSMLYSGVRNGLIAIGRNPLAKKSIIGGLFRVALTAMIVFLIGLFGVYLLLRL